MKTTIDDYICPMGIMDDPRTSVITTYDHHHMAGNIYQIADMELLEHLNALLPVQTRIKCGTFESRATLLIAGISRQ